MAYARQTMTMTMSTRTISQIAAAIACGAFTMLPTASQAQTAVPCAVTRITSIKMPKGSARYQAGTIRLSNGATLELAGSVNSSSMYPVTQMRTNDRVAACYSPLQTRYADAGPSRTITILDLRTAGYYGTLIGTWPL